MNQITTHDDIKRLGKILVVGAHPDDETFMAGGILAAAASSGNYTFCVTATKGEQGVQDESSWPKNKLASIRELELSNALSILGVSGHGWLDCRDGECAKADKSDAIKKYISEMEIDTVLVFGPDGMTGHPDHKATFHWVVSAVSQLQNKPKVFRAVIAKSNYSQYLKQVNKKLNLFFKIEKPPIYNDSECDIKYEVTGDNCDKKCAALRAMPSQTSNLIELFGDDFVKRAWPTEAFKLVDL